MEYVEGMTLRERLGSGRRIAPGDSLRLAAQIATALDAAHCQNIIHRDLKPANVMLTHASGYEEIRLVDFGIARPFGDPRSEMETLTATGNVAGTLSYMSPEQLKGWELDERTDIFSLGAVLYEMLAGRKAFSASSYAGVVDEVLNGDPPSLKDALGPTATPYLLHVVDRCLAKALKDRWQKASDALLELEWTLEQLPNPEAEGSVRTGHVEDSTREHDAPAPMVASIEAPPAESDQRTARSTHLAPDGLLFVGVALVVAAVASIQPGGRDAILYPILGIVGVLPIACLVASCVPQPIPLAARTVFRFFETWAGWAPQEVSAVRRQIVGLPLAVLTLAVLSFVFSEIADPALPHLRFIPHYEDVRAGWAIDNPDDDWGVFRARYKLGYLRSSDRSEADWQNHSYLIGRWAVRGARTLFCFAVLLGIAGVVDVTHGAFKRGTALILVGATATIALYGLWYEREGSYVEQLVTANQQLSPTLRAPLPDSAPDLLRRLGEVQ